MLSDEDVGCRMRLRDVDENDADTYLFGATGFGNSHVIGHLQHLLRLPVHAELLPASTDDDVTQQLGVILGKYYVREHADGR